mmetsp:Transcript_56254/g.137993  ORF Transcript_56254/g.137993 Transcript_56254/m.137993 type:complete len:244 (+) Transcript_56254:44-775(+)|eukprot:CAMPEP_0206238112 /NCGR_PEP_ID=MMETSP0047_2-20121206/14637_1 /ASSEMBLY_ACC=CAM_ASM_000192 /TAXON_ID=195065 /ORGANISM="Chroomonas mesostigmatica_cf, Strain CCMP1168" /LENGTH=243 /DNA_ID=CAMNT_0053662617 /DNA_START=44 /DNA_END=772 /DNA_ORIENTATION=+
MALRGLGGAVRSLGAAVERFGAVLQASDAYVETLSRHREVMGYQGKKAVIPDTSFIAPSANVIGDVSLGPRSSVWYGAILTGDAGKITVGANTSIKDRAIVGSGSTIGSGVVIGQGAVLGSVTVQDGATIGMGAKLEDGVTVQAGAYVAPGSLVAAKTMVAAGQVFAGNPAKALRALTEAEKLSLAAASGAFPQLAAQHKQENAKNFIQIEQDKSDTKWQFERNIDYDSSLGLLEKNPRAQVW